MTLMLGVKKSTCQFIVRNVTNIMIDNGFIDKWITRITEVNTLTYIFYYHFFSTFKTVKSLASGKESNQFLNSPDFENLPDF